LTLEADAGNSSIDVGQGHHQLQVRVGLNSDTDADIAIGTSLAFNNALSLNGKTLTKNGEGTLAINNILSSGGGTIIVQGGILSGAGNIGGNLLNDGGTISPGNSPGILAIPGDYVQNTDAIYTDGELSVAVVPEPLSVVLAMTALACLVGRRPTAR